jgi:hypothetical protein
MADIFISYSKSDPELVINLSAFLESEGWSVWWDKSLGAGDTYRDQIMTQLAAARAVITIWSKKSIQSDWVRAEAGRAKSEGKLIPVKTSDLSYADIPLPFGEMHTENVMATDLIRAAVVAQLAKPEKRASPFREITSTFKYQFMTWIGVIGTSITLFANIHGILDLTDLARKVVLQWQMWTQIIWAWVFSWINIRVPKEIVPFLSFVVFAAMLVVGGNLALRTGHKPVRRQNDKQVMVAALLGGVLLYPATTIVAGMLAFFLELFLPFGFFVTRAVFVVCAIAFPLVHLLYYVKERLWVLISSLLFLFMSVCLLLIPSDEYLPNAQSLFSWLQVIVLQICWMAVVLFSPLRQLTRRLGFAVLGVLTLILSNEISKLNLHRYFG